MKTVARLDATQKTREVLRRGTVGQILVSGGDGTVNEVVNGYLDHGRNLNDTVSLGIVNLGSGGDFSRALQQISSDYNTALIENRTRKVDCGRLTIGDRDRYFLNIASVGVAGKIMFSREMSSFRSGTLAYMYQRRRNELGT